MHYIPIRTRAFYPPQSDLTPTLKKTARRLRERDILLVTSKVVAIHEGRTIPIETADKDQLIIEESERYLPRASVPGGHAILTVLHHTLIASSGIDESNGNGYYILWPMDPMSSAKRIWKLLKKESGLKNIGVILTDSHSVPMRYGVIGISIGYYGFHPVNDLIGRPDIFGREIHSSKQNIPDALAAGAVYLMGETNERTPLLIARGVPNVTFASADTTHELLVPPEQDLFAPLYKSFKKSTRAPCRQKNT
jgi:F420-0:gamma-glutamyl ligase